MEKKILNLKIYEEFVEVIRTFTKRYVPHRPIREVDWFLWLYGKEFLSRENNKELKTPTDELISEYVKKAKTIPRYALGDKALRKLKSSCPSNANFEGVWLKVIVINHLYSAGVIDTFKMAQHIHKNSNTIDDKLTKGDLSAVKEIRLGHRIRKKKSKRDIDFYAFATKYCSEHKPDIYPIFDSFVRRMLFKYKGRDGFTEFVG